METQTWLNCHCKFISAENITILSVSSDDFIHAFLFFLHGFLLFLQLQEKHVKSHLSIRSHTHTHTHIYKGIPCRLHFK